ADADAVAHRGAAFLDEIEEAVRRIDDDRARRGADMNGCRHALAIIARLHLADVGGRNAEWLVLDRRIHGDDGRVERRERAGAYRRGTGGERHGDADAESKRTGA